MTDFMLVTCSNNESEARPKGKWAMILEKIIGRFHEQKRFEDTLTNALKQIVLYDHMNLFWLNLPYKIDEIKSLSRNKLVRIDEFIRKTMSDNSIQLCILYDPLTQIQELSKFSKNIFSGDFLYKSLFVHILNEIFVKRGIKIGDLDIAIVEGSNMPELLSVVRLLSKYVKYLTVVTDHKEALEEQVSEIFEETGLAVRITSDFKSGVRNSDIIINMGQLNEFALNTKINTHAIIINYGIQDASKILCDNTVINGLQVNFPTGPLADLGISLERYFNRIEIVEMFLRLKLELFKQDFCINSTESMIKMAAEFKKDKYFISGFQGRRNVIKTSDIKIK